LVDTQWVGIYCIKYFACHFKIFLSVSSKKVNPVSVLHLGQKQVVEHLLCKHEALSSNPFPTKTKTKQQNKPQAAWL
jgi:hypothetical protein